MTSNIRFIMKLVIVLSILFVTGCSTATKNGIYVTYKSDPPGATIYENGISQGYAPARFHYNVNERHRRSGRVNFMTVKALWASGASAVAEGRWAHYSNFGQELEITLTRPRGVKGRKVDLDFALQLERNRLLRRQVNAQERQADAQEDEAFDQFLETYKILK
jgi:hypothetical protein